MSRFQCTNSNRGLTHVLSIIKEVVLSLLVEAFKFSPPKEEIEWLMTGIASPVVKGLNDEHSMMPLLVESI